jgi:hypothetical protein
MTNTQFCEQCGATVDRSARFCAECGAEQVDSAANNIPDVRQSLGAAASTAAPPRASVPAAPTGPARPAPDRREGPGDSAPAPTATDPPPWPSNGSSGLPTIAELPLELWLVIAAFALPGAWIVFEMAKALPDAIKAWGAQFFGFRLGLALAMILVLVGLLGAAMLAIAWKLYHRDRVGRGLAYAFGATIVVSVLFSSARTTAEVWAMIFSFVGIGILAFSPHVRAIFDRAASLDGAPTSVVVSRTVIAIFCAIAILTAIVYLLLGSVSGKYVVAALVAAGAAILAATWSKRLAEADRTARLYLSIGGALVAVLMIALGQSATGLLFPLGLIVSAIGCLWIPNDARVFFGDQPLNISAP